MSGRKVGTGAGLTRGISGAGTLGLNLGTLRLNLGTYINQH